MTSPNKVNHIIQPLRVQSTFTHINDKYRSLTKKFPTVNLSPLKLQSATSFHLPSFNKNAYNNVFRNNMRLCISPLGSSILKKYSIKLSSNQQKDRLYSSIYNCNSKRCVCCKYLSHKSTVTSSVNGRTFNVKINTDVD